MAKKVLLRDNNENVILPITRGELILDSSGEMALHSEEFLASTSKPGLMSSSDKANLDRIAEETVDDELDINSSNPVLNKVITQIINSIREKYLKSVSVENNKLTITDQSDKSVDFFGSIYSIVTNTTDGLVPKFDSFDGTIDDQSKDWILTNHNGNLGWYKLPTSTFTQNITSLHIGDASSHGNASTANGSTYFKLFENSELTHKYKIQGTGNTAVSSDDDGNLTIYSPTTLPWNSITDKPNFAPAEHNHPYLPLAGGTLTGTLGKSNNYIFKPNGGDFRTTNSTYTGAICISLPINIGNTMLSMWIDVYNYKTNTSFSVHVGGYTYNNSTFAVNPFVMVYGALHKVRLTYNNGFKIYIGETNTTWNYPQISIRDVVLGYNKSYSNWYNDWSISFVTSFPTINSEITRYAITTDNIRNQSVNHATYTSNVGTSGTAGTNYITSANVISMYRWYNNITATDEASNTAIDKWNEIVSFLSGISDTSTLSGILAGYSPSGHNHDGRYLRLYTNSTDISNTDTLGGIYLYCVANSGGWANTSTKPTGVDNAAALLQINTHKGNYNSQLLIDGTHGQLWMRNAYNTTTWGTWKRFAYAGESYTKDESDSRYSSSTHSHPYLRLIGDTMTGVITLTSGTGAAYDKTALSFIKKSDGSEQARIGTNSSNGLGLYAKDKIYIRPNVTFGSGSTNGLVISNNLFTYNGTAVSLLGHKHSKSDITDFDHTHDNRYYTETEVNNLLANKSNTDHTHDNYLPSYNMMNSAYAYIPTYDRETGWHRIATIVGSRGYGSYILYLCGNWHYAPNTNAIIHIDTMHTTAQLTQVSGIVGYINKIRLVNVDGNKYYVDVHINYTGANSPGNVYCYFLGNGSIETRTSAEKITTAVTASAELTLVTGGCAHFSELASLVPWAGITNKPSTFTPESHSHNILETYFKFVKSDVTEDAVNLSTSATAHTMTFYRNGISIPYQMDNVNDGGLLRVRGTTENNVIYEMATWDDKGAGETILFNYYPTTSAATPTHSVSVPKKSGIIALTNDIPTSLPANGGNADTVGKLPATAFMRATLEGSFYGIQHPNGDTSNWTRTTSNGIIPYKHGGSSSLGTLTWPFNTVYATTFYGTLSGNAATATKLSNFYSSRPSKLEPDTIIGDGSMYQFKSTSTANSLENYPGDGHILHFEWDNTGGYNSQLYIRNSDGLLKTRGMNGKNPDKSGNWSNWKTVLDSGNVSQFALPYIEKTVAQNANTLLQNGIYNVKASITGAPVTNWGSLLSINNGYYAMLTYWPDNGLDMYIRRVGILDSSKTTSWARVLSNINYNSILPVKLVNGLSYWDMISKGYLRNDYVDAKYPVEDYLKALCKQLINSHKGYACVGSIRPSTAGSYICYVYDCSINTTTGLPEYMVGTAFLFGGGQVYFGTSSGVWYYRYTLTSANYNSWVPSKTGTGASGTWGISITGNASSATKLTYSAGSATIPIYFSDGKPVACTPASIFSDLSNDDNNISMTVAGQNRKLTVAYASNADKVDGYSSESFAIWRGDANTDSTISDVTSTSTSDFFAKINATSKLFNSRFGAMRGSWYYKGNTQLDTGVGRLDMAGTAVLNLGSNADTNDTYKSLLFLDQGGRLWSYTANETAVKQWSRYAKTTDIKDPVNYYWANIKVSDTSNDYTTPSFGKVTICDKVNSRLVLKTANANELAYLAAYNTGGQYGADIVLNSGSAMVLGAGESAASMYSNNVDNLQGSENLYLTADGSIKIFTNCDSINNRKQVLHFTTSGYAYFGSYINIGGHEKNESSPTYVWGSNNSDSFLRSYKTSSLSVNHATTASYLPTKYDGGDKPDPQYYFNYNVGVKVAMTRYANIGGTSSWFDTLWINGYAGGDVPNMVALTTIRNGTPRAFLSAQSNRSNTYGTYYEIISSYNIGSQSVNYATSSGIARALGTDDSMKLYALIGNEINFGGTDSSNTIYFGYRAKDSKPIPTNFVFGGGDGSATLKANGFSKKGSSDSYILLGGGGHKAISNIDVPVGTILMWPSNTLPNNYMLCDGSSLNKNTYATLFAVLGTTYGGSGNNFNLPNLKGKFIVGKDTNVTDYNGLAKTGGKNKVKLSLSEIPLHNHDSENSTYKLKRVNTYYSGEHSHNVRWGSYNGNSKGDGYYAGRTGGSSNYPVHVDTDATFNTTWYGEGDINLSSDKKGFIAKTNAHIHLFDMYSSGGDGEHENRPPFIVLNYIIKVK